MMLLVLRETVVLVNLDGMCEIVEVVTVMEIDLVGLLIALEVLAWA
jgi:hypothetical protein